MSTEQTEAAKEKNREEHQNSYETKAAGKIKADVLARANFPIILGDTEKADIIKEWQSEMDLDNWVMKPCAVCSQRTPKRELSVLNHEDVDFRLLQNPHLPNETLPTTYNLLVYEYAILNPNALHDRENLGALDVCRSCETELVDRNRQPKNALANWHYSGFDEIPIAVQKAFKDSSMFDLMMVARCRSTRITQLYSNKKGSPNYQGDASESQRYDRGNVSIIPQDSVTLRPMLPPDDDEIRTTMAALFTGSRDRPTAENISKFSPVLVSKTRIKIILDFLLSKNMWYRNSGTVFSADNYDNLFGPDDKDKDEAVPRAVDLCWLPPEASKIKEGGTADYTDRNEFNRDDSDSDVVMEAVGYTAGDRTPQNYRVMKASALAWCLARKKFIKMKGASELLSDNDTAFLTYLFPHLDPWGIMGFKQSERTESQRISFDQQVKNYLLLHDSPFQADPNFAYVCWNVMQKREVNKTACFRTSAQNQASIVAELTQIGPTIPDLIQKWEKDPMAKPSNREEKRALKLLNKIKLVAKELKGSSGYKLCRRNEIRALMKKYSTPALFVTINPADVYHPLLGVMGGKEAEEWRAMSRHERAVFVARNPGPAAQFFDTMITSFVKHILRHGTETGGVFGVSEAYYGMVEAQGRGTLHCHLLIWIKGNPGPQELRDRMANSVDFKDRMFGWIESIISCELPGMMEVLLEPDSALLKPKMKTTEMDVRMKAQPLVVDMTEEEFANEFRDFVKELAIRCNWHEHSETCWKHLRPNERRGDSVCRMRINGSTRSFTELDEETQSILLRRLHPRINNFNDVSMFLMQCNMDVKYIGSGDSAKALIYYVTDYITKESLTTHVGLEALTYAINRNDQKFSEDMVTPDSLKAKSLFVKTVNSMMARQEMSHQQVMSYLIGGGDHYKSETFRLLKWAELDRFIRAELKETQWDRKEVDPTTEELDEGELNRDMSGSAGIHLNSESLIDDVDKGITEQTTEDVCMNDFSTVNLDATDDVADDITLEENQEGTIHNEENLMADVNQISLQVDGEQIVPTDNLLDYIHRSKDEAFTNLSVWEHCEWVVKLTKTSEGKRMNKGNWERNSKEPRRSRRNQKESKRRGRRATARGDFSWARHPNFKTHTTRLRESPFVPVLLGDALPRNDRGPNEREQWCRAMIILFTPWRNASDLLSKDDTWLQRFEKTAFSESAQSIISNINVENECKDARDAYSKKRRDGTNVSPLLDGFAVDDSHDVSSLGVAIANDVNLDRSDDLDDDSDQQYTDDYDVRKNDVDDELVGIASRAGLFDAQSSTDENLEITGKASIVGTHEKEIMRMQSVLMDAKRKDKRPLQKPATPREDITAVSGRGEALQTIEETTLSQIEESAVFIDVQPRAKAEFSPQQALEDIIKELGIAGNDEQERAIRTVCDHFINGTEEQLLCHISGPGGTGKSYVVHAIVEFFRRCGASDALLLSASTGCAAVLIHGYTLHALTFLGPRKTYTKPEALERLWRDVKYLVIDEISMISAHFFNQVSERISKAKAWDPNTHSKPFGGVNLIITGDIGQLAPVNASSLFSHNLVEQIKANTSQTTEGQAALNGAFLWRQINKVVILKRNVRAQGDKPFINLLARIRNGEAWNGRGMMSQLQKGTGENYDESDYEVLLKRHLNILANKDKSVLQTFKNAPIVVGEKTLRDALNNKVVEGFAKKTNQELHWYQADDTYKKAPLSGNLRTRMLRVRSNVSDDALGMLPLVPGMKVMVTDNVAMSGGIANGSEGTLLDIKYEMNEHGHRRAVCAYVRVPGSNVCAPGLEPDVVPIMPIRNTFKYVDQNKTVYYISRSQLPLLPAYAYTANKIQGQSLKYALVDLKSAKGTQALYVMISRAVSLNNLAVLRWFKGESVNRRLSPAYRNEFARLAMLDIRTKDSFNAARTV